MASLENLTGCLDEDWFQSTAVSNLNNVSNVQINIIDSGAESTCPVTNRYRKWKMPTSHQSQNNRGNSTNFEWLVILKVLRPVQITNVSAWIQFTEQNHLTQVPIQNRSCAQGRNENVVEEILFVSLDQVLDIHKTGKTLIKLILCFDQLQITTYDVCDFEIKELQVDTVINEQELSDGGAIGIRVKKQMVTGPHKGRCQRLEKKDLSFSLKTNIPTNEMTLCGYVKRVNDAAMLGKEKAVSGEIEVPLTLLRNLQGANGQEALSYGYDIKADLDPENFYIEYPGKELYTSDKTTPENNIFLFGIRISVGNRSFIKEVYQFKTKSKDYSASKQQYISAMELEATRAHINDLRIQKLTTVRGDIAYSWKLLDSDSAERYEEGDVIGIFANKFRPNDKTYLDLLTPNNYQEAILAGVITRSYYIAANSPEDDHENPSEKLCMMGKIPIKISGPVKHGDFIYASPKLPGVGVSEEQFCADRGNCREKRLLGYSLETKAKDDVKLVSCVVSILLSINNDQVERLLGKLEKNIFETFGRRIDEFRDDVDIKMDGMSEIVQTAQNYVVEKGREVSRRKRRVCTLLIFFFILAILSSYFFLSPNSPYLNWKCRRGCLPGRITFKIENNNDEDLVRMEGILFNVEDLRRKTGVNFALKKNFTGSYYFNLRKCKRDNIRKVLGWFSSPPVYSRAQVFASSCECDEIFHYHQYRSWVKYDPVVNVVCEGHKGSQCNQTIAKKK